VLAVRGREHRLLRFGLRVASRQHLERALARGRAEQVRAQREAARRSREAHVLEHQQLIGAARRVAVARLEEQVERRHRALLAAVAEHQAPADLGHQLRAVQPHLARAHQAVAVIVEAVQRRDGQRDHHEGRLAHHVDRRVLRRKQVRPRRRGREQHGRRQRARHGPPDGGV
jgi:hypothetical protein